MGQNSAILDCEKMGELGEKTISKSNNTKNKQFD